MVEKIKLENGKYTFFISDNGHTVGCLRFGEPWVIFDEGSKALISLLSKIKELEEGIELLKNVDGTSDVSYSIDAKRKLYKLIEKEKGGRPASFP